MDRQHGGGCRECKNQKEEAALKTVKIVRKFADTQGVIKMTTFGKKTYISAGEIASARLLKVHVNNFQKFFVDTVPFKKLGFFGHL